MTPLKLVETKPGWFSLLLDAGDTAVDGLVEELGHEPNGFFWEGVAQFLIGEEAPELDGRVELDPEAGMFCAYGNDRAALERLGTLMAAVANDEEGMRNLLEAAEENGFEFDD